jgi:hypothetical protein
MQILYLFWYSGQTDGQTDKQTDGQMINKSGVGFPHYIPPGKNLAKNESKYKHHQSHLGLRTILIQFLNFTETIC